MDHINACRILAKIDPTSTTLNISNLGLTRFPAHLFEDETLQDYWKKLKRLDCKKNWLESLPTQIDGLSSLEKVNCSDNCLQSLPETLESVFVEVLYLRYIDKHNIDREHQKPVKPKLPVLNQLEAAHNPLTIANKRVTKRYETLVTRL